MLLYDNLNARICCMLALKGQFTQKINLSSFTRVQNLNKYISSDEHREIYLEKKLVTKQFLATN